MTFNSVSVCHFVQWWRQTIPSSSSGIYEAKRCYVRCI